MQDMEHLQFLTEGAGKVKFITGGMAWKKE